MVKRVEVGENGQVVFYFDKATKQQKHCVVFNAVDELGGGDLQPAGMRKAHKHRIYCQKNATSNEATTLIP